MHTCKGRKQKALKSTRRYYGGGGIALVMVQFRIPVESEVVTQGSIDRDCNMTQQGNLYSSVLIYVLRHYSCIDKLQLYMYDRTFECRLQ